VTDPVRSRTFFLQILDAPKRRKFLHELVKQMQAYHLETKAHLAHISERDDLFNYLGALGAVSITAARLDWLRLIEKRLAKL
jgi:recombinational DNA repair ATPase RecF